MKVLLVTPPMSNLSRSRGHPLGGLAGQTVRLTLRMGDGYDETRAARELNYVREFGDDTKPAYGKRCFHFYPGEGVYPLTVRAGIGSDEPKALRLRDAADGALDVTVATKPKPEPGVAWVQRWVFFATFGIAILTAFALHLSQVVGDSAGQLLIPFLIGLGIDQVREKIAKGEIKVSDLAGKMKTKTG